jgi:hypothetical protein
MVGSPDSPHPKLSHQDRDRNRDLNPGRDTRQETPENHKDSQQLTPLNTPKNSDPAPKTAIKTGYVRNDLINMDEDSTPHLTGRYPSSNMGGLDNNNLGFASRGDSSQPQEHLLEVSDDEDNPTKLPTTVTTDRNNKDKTKVKAKSVAFLQESTPQQFFSDIRSVRYPSMSAHLQAYAEDGDTEIRSQAWLSPANSRSPSPSAEATRALGVSRMFFENQPSNTFVVPQDNDATTFDVWETNKQGQALQKKEIKLTSLEDKSEDNDDIAFVTNLVVQLRDMWANLTDERARYDQASDYILKQAATISSLRESIQDHQDNIEGYKGDLTESRDQLTSADTRVSQLEEQLRNVRGTVHLDHLEVQRLTGEAQRLLASKMDYKNKYRREYAAHKTTRSSKKDLQAWLKKAEASKTRSPTKRSRAGPTPPDYSDDESNDDLNPFRQPGSRRDRSPNPHPERHRSRSPTRPRRSHSPEDDAPRGYSTRTKVCSREHKPPTPNAITKSCIFFNTTQLRQYYVFWH